MKKSVIFRFTVLAGAILILISGCNKPVVSDKLNIDYEKYVMPNGLQVILHNDHSDPMISYAIMYHVGSSREKPGKTGFAHLFEHLLFGGSENVEPGKFDMVIEAAGGTNNGGTDRDMTVYYEVFPKNALEKILWLESDRMGFFINSVTQRTLAIQQNVVQNEKRQYEDNSPYGFTDYVISKNLYPEGHPYRWEVIGEMEDLRNATLEDVREYYGNYYGPNNATLVLAGDFNPDSARILIEKYFGEIKSHGDVAPRTAMPVALPESKRIFHEDNFANAPEITLVWPAPERFSKDAYALDFLAKILSDGKKAPLYKVLVKEKQLTSATNAYIYPGELAGEFAIRIRANEGKTLKEIEKTIFESLILFENEGFTEKDVERIKTVSEKNFYEGLNSVYNKSLNLAYYNTFLNDPGYFIKDIENIKAVSSDDILRVYNTYIKNRPYVVTSFIPKGRPELAAENSVHAGIKEEDISDASQVSISETGTEQVVKTPSLVDRTAEPPSGKEPEAPMPEIWRKELSSGIKVYGIQTTELPLVNLRIVIEGGVSLDKTELPGVANMLAAMLPQGTKTKTPEELEEEIELLGSNINVYTGREELILEASMLSRNFGKTFSLMKEILLEPRWDTSEYRITSDKIRNDIIQAEAQPRSVASLAFYKLVYGTRHIFGFNTKGTKESVDKITLEDLVKYYDKNISPSVTKILVAGNVSEEEAIKTLESLNKEWHKKQVTTVDYPEPEIPQKSTIYFVDIPGSRQSVVYIGYPALKRSDPDFVKADFINYRLGGAFTSILNQILREEKGFTYGASSYFQEMKTTAPFIAAASVRSDATFETVKIFRDELEKYRNGISEADIQFIKNCIIRSNALRFETNNALVGMLSVLSKYDFTNDYIRKEEDIIREMTVEEHKKTAEKYMIPNRMYYVVVGDAATQMKPLDKIGFGKPILLEK